MQKYDLNIKEILENWKVSDAVREIIANAIDEQLFTNTQDVIINKKSGKWVIKDFGRGLSISNFSQNENKDKINAEGMIGKFGIGLKDAIAVLHRNKVSFEIRTNKFRAYPRLDFKEGLDIKTIHMIIDYIDDNALEGTEFIFENLLDKDLEKAKENFLLYNAKKIISENSYGQVLQGQQTFIYVNGMKIAESENYLYSYNIKKTNKKLTEKMNRERKSIGQEAYSKLVEKILVGNISNDMAKELFNNKESGEMQKKSIRKEVYEKINDLGKYVFLTEKQYQELDANQIEVYKTLGKKIQIIKEVDSSFLGFLYNNTSAFEDFNNSFDFEIIEEEKLNKEQKNNYIKAKDVIKKLNKKMELKIANKNNPLHNDTLGYWSYSEPKTIYIVLKALNKWENTLKTILHEFAHSIHGNLDNTREFEMDLENVWYYYSELLSY